MSKYVEATLRTRQLFFLGVILLGGLILFLDRVEAILPPLSRDPVLAIEQFAHRSMVAALVLSVFYLVLSAMAINLAKRSADSGQWPPKGMTVPFRTKIIEIKKQRYVWLYLTIILSVFTAQAAMPWVRYEEQRELLKELKTTVQVVPNRAL
jgi:hypothetical protein